MINNREELAQFAKKSWDENFGGIKFSSSDIETMVRLAYISGYSSGFLKCKKESDSYECFPSREEDFSC